jgi:CheY-like chemotaxis protein
MESIALAVGREDVKSVGVASSQDVVKRPSTVEARNKSLRALLVEDNPTNQTVAQAILKRLSVECEFVNNGAEALAKLQTSTFDIVLMDCQMPVMDGFEATKRIRNGEDGLLNPRIPIIAMTAHALEGDRERCLEAGMDDYVAKPLHPSELNEAIIRVTSLHVIQPTGQDNEHTNEAPCSKAHTVCKEEVFNESEFLERLDNDRELAHDVMDAFLSDTPQQIQLLGDLVNSADAPAIRRQAHGIKGAALNISAPTLSAIAFEMEEMGRDGNLENVTDALSRLQAAFQHLKQVLEWNDLMQSGTTQEAKTA